MSRTLKAILKHWAAEPLKEGGVIELPFNLELFCQEFDELLAKLEPNPVTILGQETFHKEGGLYDLGRYLNWNIGEDKATLDGRFTAEELRAIALVMELKK